MAGNQLEERPISPARHRPHSQPATREGPTQPSQETSSIQAGDNTGHLAQNSVSKAKICINYHQTCSKQQLRQNEVTEKAAFPMKDRDTTPEERSEMTTFSHPREFGVMTAKMVQELGER